MLRLFEQLTSDVREDNLLRSNVNIAIVVSNSKMILIFEMIFQPPFVKQNFKEKARFDDRYMILRKTILYINKRKTILYINKSIF